MKRILVCIFALLVTLPALAVDLVISGIEGVTVWKGKPHGKFKKTHQGLSPFQHNVGGALGDLNGDGYLDWFGVRFDSEHQSHQVWFGKGNGNFVPSKQKFGGKYPSWGVVLEDIDGYKDWMHSYPRLFMKALVLHRNSGVIMAKANLN